MTPKQLTLWAKIKSFELDDPKASLMFSDRLARENGWSLEFSHKAIWEYKKFMFLICISEHPLTPSDQVDQVWHLHLLYTQSYWADFCQNTLGKTIHHGPTKGGRDEGNKFTDWYERTKLLYATVFQYNPPPDIWPSSAVRFSQINFQRINLDRNWIIKKPNWL